MASGALTRASLHHAILRSFVTRGHAPSHAELTASFGVEPAAMTAALQELAAYRGVVLHPHAPEVWIAHPFSSAPTTFVVRHEDRLWWGNCAWCSLGIAALLGGRGVTIETTLGAQGRPVAIHVEEHQVREDLVVHFPIPMARAWDNVIFTCSTMARLRQRERRRCLVTATRAAARRRAAHPEGVRLRARMVRRSPRARVAEVDHRRSARPLREARAPRSHMGPPANSRPLLSRSP